MPLVNADEECRPGSVADERSDVGRVFHLFFDVLSLRLLIGVENNGVVSGYPVEHLLKARFLGRVPQDQNLSRVDLFLREKILEVQMHLSTVSPVITARIVGKYKLQSRVSGPLLLLASAPRAPSGAAWRDRREAPGELWGRGLGAGAVGFGERRVSSRQRAGALPADIVSASRRPARRGVTVASGCS